MSVHSKWLCIADEAAAAAATAAVPVPPVYTARSNRAGAQPPLAASKQAKQHQQSPAYLKRSMFVSRGPSKKSACSRSMEAVRWAYRSAVHIQGQEWIAAGQENSKDGNRQGSARCSGQAQVAGAGNGMPILAAKASRETGKQGHAHTCQDVQAGLGLHAGLCGVQRSDAGQLQVKQRLQQGTNKRGRRAACWGTG